MTTKLLQVFRITDHPAGYDNSKPWGVMETFMSAEGPRQRICGGRYKTEIEAKVALDNLQAGGQIMALTGPDGVQGPQGTRGNHGMPGPDTITRDDYEARLKGLSNRPQQPNQELWNTSYKAAMKSLGLKFVYVTPSEPMLSTLGVIMAPVPAPCDDGWTMPAWIVPDPDVPYVVFTQNVSKRYGAPGKTYWATHFVRRNRDGDVGCITTAEYLKYLRRNGEPTDPFTPVAAADMGDATAWGKYHLPQVGATCKMTNNRKPVSWFRARRSNSPHYPEFTEAFEGDPETPIWTAAFPVYAEDATPYKVGPLTLERVFHTKPRLINMSDMQEVLDRVERALATALAEIDLTEGRR